MKLLKSLSMIIISSIILMGCGLTNNGYEIGSITADSPVTDEGNIINSIEITMNKDIDGFKADDFKIITEENNFEINEVKEEGNKLTLHFDNISYITDFTVECSKNKDLNFSRSDIKVDGHELDKFIAEKNEVLGYRLFIPENTEEKVPLVLSLHGAGITGDDNIRQIATNDNSTGFVREDIQKDYPCYVLAPQLPDRYVTKDESPTDKQTAKGWTDEEVQTALIDIINELKDKYENIDDTRIYVTGHSMGGLGTWGMSTAYPDYFAASAPISGLWEGDVDMLVNLPMWVFHGETDSLVPLNKQKDAVDKLSSLGGNVKWSQYSDEELKESNVSDAHMANIPTYNSTEFYEWLFAQKK